MNIASLTDHANTPSSRFRIRQFNEELFRRGIKVTDFPRQYSTQSAGRFFPAKKIRSNLPKLLTAGFYELLNLQNTLARTLQTRHYDAAWISRELVIGYPTFEKLLCKPYFYDIDDAVFLRGKTGSAGVRKLIEASQVVFAGNKYLADFCRQYSSKVLIVPTAVDVDRFTIPAARTSDKLVLGWSGTSSSFAYFQPIEQVLVDFLKSHPDVLLKICSDRFPKELTNLARHIEFEPWSAAREVEQIQSFDVGIMPLENSKWVRGKCSYKMLLYCACGIPTITSSFGMNKDVLEMGRVGVGCEDASQWRDALAFVYESRKSLKAVFPDCRDVVVKNFSLEVVVDQISSAMLAAV